MNWLLDCIQIVKKIMSSLTKVIKEIKWLIKNKLQNKNLKINFWVWTPPPVDSGRQGVQWCPAVTLEDRDTGAQL